MTSRRLPVFVLVVLVLGLAGCGGEDYAPSALADGEPEVLARLAVAADSAAARSFFFSDQDDGFFYDVLAGPQTDVGMGYVVGGFRVVDGWRWFVGDSLSLGPRTVAGGVVRPDFAARTYAEPDTLGLFAGIIRSLQGPDLAGFTEVITLTDDALLVQVPDSAGTLALYPVLTDRRADGYTVEAQGDALLVARNNYLERREGDRRPVWLAIAATGGEAAGRALATERIVDLGVRERPVAPGRVLFPTPGVVAFGTGGTQAEALARARRALGSPERALEQQAARAVAALEGGTIRTGDEAFNRAFDWARISLDALVTGDTSALTLASGIPGTRMPRGRSTLTALEGAFLAQGRFEEAEQLLLNFGRAQQRDRRLDLFGRIPNEFVNGRPQYTTVDATPVFVDAVGDYLRTTGDRGLITRERAEFWTRTVYAMRGLEDIQADGLLANRRGETWVQPYEGRGFSPRTNRAAEVQGRYYRGFRAMQPIARIMGQLSGRPTSVAAYRDSADAVQRRFRQAFLRDDLLADVVRPEGRPEGEIRPSTILALRDLDLDPEVERAVLRRVAEELVYPYGVSTRSQRDSLFHPYLDAPDYYSPEAALYEGTVWTWLAGPLVSLLVEHGAPGLAYEQTEALQRLLLDRGVVGAIAENLDAHPRPAAEGEEQGEPAVGGSPVQPWTLAEFIRNAYQDYVGIRYRAGNDVVLEPHLPAAWGETMARFRMGDGWVRAYLAQEAGELAVSVVPEAGLPADARLRLRAFGQEKRLPLVRMQGDTLALPADSVRVVLTAETVRVGDEEVPPDSTYTVADAGFWEGFTWARPEVQEEYPVMRQVKRARQLDAPQVARQNPRSVPILTRTDPTGDDWGTSATYTYPENFPADVLDATYLEITEDDSTFYFQVELAALADPSELGFQPTFAALAFDTEDGGKRDVGRNSQYRFPEAEAFEYIAFVSDGLRVEDDRGRVLGEFERLGEQLVDVEQGSIRFALPKYVIPDLPRGTTATLLVGARSEGGGIGEFRAVQEQASSLVGGGKISPRDPNVYDVLTASVTR